MKPDRPPTSDLRPPFFARYRRRRCESCPAQCTAFLDGTLALTDPAIACPLRRWFPAIPPIPSQRSQKRPAKPRRLSPCKADPKKWGPPLWAEFHAHPDLDLEAFTRRIPCHECRAHFRAAAAAAKLPAGTFAWAVEIHNAVNERLGLKPWTIEAAIARWG